MSDSSAPLFVAPAAEELAPLFPNYEIHGLIACGGMGAVYRARQASLDRIVAIKILPPELGSDREYAERFQSEARLMANLSNPHIVTVYDFGLAGSYLYFVMEFVAGRSLHEVIKEDGAMKPEACIRTMAEVCRGLDYAHGKGLVHLDIKPANIMINEEGEARVLDFGLAKISDPTKGSATETMGTPDYAAPERTLDNVKVDHRADIYSLGIMLYELLTGRIPRGNFTPASQVAGVSLAFDAIISKCTQPDPANRFQKAGEIFGALVKMRREAAHLKRAVLRGSATTPAKSEKSDAVAAYQQMMAGKGSKVLLGWVFGMLAVGAVVAGLVFSGVFDGGDGRKKKGGSRKVATGEREREEPFPPVPFRPDKGKGGRDGDGGEDAGGEVVETDPAPAPDQGRKEKFPFPPGGLKEEIALVREAMDAGTDLADLELNHLRVFNDHVYYVIPRRISWDKAAKMAEGQGAHLATLQSEEEEKFVRETYFGEGAEDRGSRPLWIGAQISEENWEWVTGEDWEYEAWGEDGTEAIAGGATVAVIHENSWTGRNEDDAYAALIEWDPPEKVAVVPPMAEPGVPGMPVGPKVPAVPLSPMEKLRGSFEERIRIDVVEKRERELKVLGENYLKALEGLAEKWETVPERYVQISTEKGRFTSEWDVPVSVDSWPELARVQGVLLTVSSRIDSEAREKRQQLIKTYGDALLTLQADFSSKGKWDDVNIAKKERARVEKLKREESLTAVVPVPKALTEIGVLVEKGEGIRSVTTMPDGERFLVTGWDGILRVFSAEEGGLEEEWDAGHPLGRTAFLPGGDRFLALNPDGHMEVWSLERQVQISTAEETEGSPVRLSVSPDGKACVVGLSRFRPPKEGGTAGIRPWAISDSPVQGEFSPKVSGWTAFSPDGKFLAVSTVKSLALIVYGETDPVWTNTDCGGEAVAFSPDGSKVVCGRIVVDAASGDTLTDLRKVEAERYLDDVEARWATVNGLALDRDGKHVIFGLAGGGIEVWNLNVPERVVNEVDAHSKVITSVVMSGDGKRLATSDVGGLVRLWEVVR